MVRKIPLFILAVGAVLRVAWTGASAIWYDEANIIHRSTIPFLTLFQETSENSGDLLLELILRPLLAISHSIWILRLPSILAGLVSLWLVWVLMQRLEFTFKQQIVAAAIVAFLPGLIWIAQDARSYGLLACLFLAGIYFAVEGRWLGLLATCGLMIYAHKIGVAFALTSLLIADYLHPRQTRWILLVSAGALLAWIPAIVNMLSRWIIQQPWQPQITFPWLVSSAITAIWPMINSGLFLLLAFLLLIRTLFFLFSKNRTNGRIIPLAAWILPVLVLIAASLVTRNNFVIYRTFMPALFPFALWLGWEMGKQKIPALSWILMLVLGMTMWNPYDRGGRLDQVADQIRSQWKTGDQLIYTTATVGMPFEYYLSDLPHTWDDTARSDFMLILSYPRISIDPSTGAAARSWVVIPDDGLIMPSERDVLMDLVHHQEPLYTIRYMQAATIQVYLVEEK
jgi:hypothetical protein